MSREVPSQVLILCPSHVLPRLKVLLPAASTKRSVPKTPAGGTRWRPAAGGWMTTALRVDPPAACPPGRLEEGLGAGRGRVALPLAWRGEEGRAAGNSWRRRHNLLSALGLNSPAQMDTDPAVPLPGSAGRGGAGRLIRPGGGEEALSRRWMLTAGAAGGWGPERGPRAGG